MAVALAYPESKQGKKDEKTSQKNCEVNRESIRQARFVLRHCLEKAEEMLRNVNSGDGGSATPAVEPSHFFQILEKVDAHTQMNRDELEIITNFKTPTCGMAAGRFGQKRLACRICSEPIPTHAAASWFLKVRISHNLRHPCGQQLERKIIIIINFR